MGELKMNKNLPLLSGLLLVAQLSFGVAEAQAQKKYDVGANDKEIIIGNVMAYSGPASAYGSIGKSIRSMLKVESMDVRSSFFLTTMATSHPKVSNKLEN